MIILIGGSSHVGKTLFSRMLMERYHVSALSQDHLKMGLIRARETDLTPEDDDKLQEYLWPITAEIIKTAIENRQDLIVEGCYIPGNWAASFTKDYLKEIRPVFLVMDERYIRNHFGKIQRFANAAEYRIAERLDREELIRCNAFNKEEAEKHGTPVLEIRDSFDPEELFKKLASLLELPA